MAKIHNTHNEYLPPFHDSSKKLIIFSHAQYHIPDDGMREGYYNNLTNAVKDKNYNSITRILKQMSPFYIRTKIQVARKQTRVVDSVTRQSV